MDHVGGASMFGVSGLLRRPSRLLGEAVRLTLGLLRPLLVTRGVSLPSLSAGGGSNGLNIVSRVDNGRIDVDIDGTRFDREEGL